MPIRSYTFGTTIQVKVRLTDPNTKQPVESVSPAIIFRKPNNVNQPALSGPTTLEAGTYIWTVVADMAGTWSYRVTTPGPAPAAAEGQFYVMPSIIS